MCRPREDGAEVVGPRRDGLAAEDGEAIWPENVQAVQVFVTLSTQWRIGPSGHLMGLEYTAIPAVLALLRIPRGAWPELFADLRAMEGAAVEALRPSS